MRPVLTLATAGRVLAQLRHDPRTLGLLTGLPCLLIGLLAWMFDGTPVLDRMGPLLVGLFPMIVMFLVTSVATLRERQSGTLERLMATPIGKADVVVGYALAFGLVATVQAGVVTAFAVWVCGMDVAGSVVALMVIAVLVAVLGAALGLGASAAARTEFQAVQMMPATMFPQILLCGLLMPREEMPAVLEAISRALPMTYALDALVDVAGGASLIDAAGAVGVVVAFIVGALVLGSVTLRRRTP